MRNCENKNVYMDLGPILHYLCNFLLQSLKPEETWGINLPPLHYEGAGVGYIFHLETIFNFLAGI